MNRIAIAQDLAEEGENAKPFTTARRVGWLLKRILAVCVADEDVVAGFLDK